jgi:branched-chain amino acid transport system ATP-binding protein
MLDIKNLAVEYGGIKALRRVSLSIGANQAVALLGANGAGKSSLLRAISGLERLREGEITLDGRRLHGLHPEAIVGAGISHVPEGRGMFPDMTVEQNLQMGAYARRNRAQVSRDLEAMFSRFPMLSERKRQLAGTLSGGEQQIVAIARGLMARPRILLLDEPSLGVAPILAKEIFRMIKTIKDDGMSILLVEQNATLALPLIDYCYVLRTGAVAWEGKPDQVSNVEKLIDSYFGAKEHAPSAEEAK